MMVTTQSLTNRVEVKADQIDPDLGNNKAEVITDPPPLASPVVTLLDFLGSKDFAEFMKLVNTTYDTGLCILDSWIVVAPVVLTKGALKQTFPVPPDMAQHCAGAFQPIVDLLRTDQ
jgi:hypothetical protein